MDRSGVISAIKTESRLSFMYTWLGLVRFWVIVLLEAKYPFVFVSFTYL